MLTIKNLVDKQRSVPFLLGRRVHRNRQLLDGQVEYVLHCFDVSKKGQGVDAKQRFPFCSSSNLHGVRNDNSFSMKISFVISNKGENEQVIPIIKVKVEGDFLQIMDYVFNKKPDHLKLNIVLDFWLPGERVAREKGSNFVVNF